MRQIKPSSIQKGFSGSESSVLMMTDMDDAYEIPILIGPVDTLTLIECFDNNHKESCHSLMLKTLEEYLIHLEEVRITSFEEGIFHSILILNDGFGSKKVNSRTCDAIILGMMCGCPIYIEDKVFEETAIECSSNDRPDAFDIINDDWIDPSDTSKLTTSHFDNQIAKLTKRLHHCEELEQYEEAAKILELINKVTELKKLIDKE